MTGTEYLKADFEADLRSLGDVRFLPPRELGRIDEQPDQPVVLTDALGRGAVALFQDQMGPGFDEAVKVGSASRPTAYHLEDGSLHVQVGEHALQVPNPYSLTGYFPNANDGRGTAALYAMPDIAVPLEHASRYITEQEASNLIADTAIPLTDGMFVSRPEAEAIHYTHYVDKSCARLPAENLIMSKIPRVVASVDPAMAEGSFTRLNPGYVARGAVVNRFDYTGRAALTSNMGSVPVYKRTEDGTLNQLAGMVHGEVVFTEANKGFFTYSYTEHAAWDIDDLLRMMRAQAGGQPTPPLTEHIGIHKALEQGLINQDTFIYTPAPATRILYDALATGPDTPYFHKLRRELGPAFDREPELVADARRVAHARWLGALSGGEKVEPVVQGLEEVASLAGIRRTSATKVITSGGNVFMVQGGDIIFHR